MAWWLPHTSSEEYALYAIVAILIGGCCVCVVAMSVLCWCKCGRGSDVGSGATSAAGAGAKHVRVPSSEGGDVELACAAAEGSSAPHGALPLSDGEEAKVIPVQCREEQPLIQAQRALELHALPDLESSVFERNWDALDVRAQWRSASYVSAGVSDDALIELLALSFIFCIASGRVGDVSKHYYYSVDEPSGDLFFAELLIDTAHGLRGSVKSTCTSPRAVKAYGALVQHAVDALVRESGR